MTSTPAPRYDHTQTGKVHYGLWALGVGLLVGGLAMLPGDAREVLVPVGALLLVITPMFASLRVRDTGDALRVNFGPVPLLRRTVAYDDIVAFRPRKTPWIHGIGLHGWPGRWWTWNIAGRDCVTLTVRKDGEDATLNIGTDDPEGLVRHLSETLDARLRDTDTEDAAA